MMSALGGCSLLAWDRVQAARKRRQSTASVVMRAVDVIVLKMGVWVDTLIVNLIFGSGTVYRYFKPVSYTVTLNR